MNTSNTALLQRLAPVLLADDGDKYLDGPVTAHACMADGYAQYWLAYPGDPDHTGTDWEMVMYAIDAGGQPTHAVYAQHRGLETRPWSDVRKVDWHPLVLVGRDKHSSRFSGEWHHHGLHLERTNGKRHLQYELRFDVPTQITRRLAHTNPDEWIASHTRGRSCFRRAFAAFVP